MPVPHLIAFAVLVLALASGPDSRLYAAASTECSPAVWNPGALPRHCQLFDTVCADHGAIFITHDERYQIENVRRDNTPGLPGIAWNLPVRANSFPDALAGWQPEYQITMRPTSKVEPTLQLRHPVFSNCTVPVIIIADYPYNYKTFLVKVLPDVDNMFRVKGLSADRDLTLVLATPGGLALEPFHAALLQPYSRRPVITLAELGRRGSEGRAAEWSGEGVRVHCFNKLATCKLNQHDNVAPHVAAAAVAEHMGNALTQDPLGFGAPPDSAGGLVLRVVFEARNVPWRSIKNVDALLRFCEEMNTRGFIAGPFRAVQCKALRTSYDTAPPATGSLGPTSPGVLAYQAALGAVRSAHLFVAAPGSSGAHAFFMQHSQTGGAGFLEVRPCGWGSTHAAKADSAQDSMALQLQKGDDAIRFFAYNVEDPGQCSPPDYSPALKAALDSKTGLPWQEPQAAHIRQSLLPPRYTPEELLARDQHLNLRPVPLMEMIRHAAELLPDKAAYAQAREAGRLHGYGVAEGLLLGQLGLTDAPARARAGDAALTRA